MVICIKNSLKWVVKNINYFSCVVKILVEVGKAEGGTMAVSGSLDNV